MSSENITNRTRSILARVLNVDPSEISDDASTLNLSAWDSLRHMNVILSLENEFEIEFRDEEIQKLHSLDLLIQSIRAHTGG